MVEVRRYAMKNNFFQGIQSYLINVMRYIYIIYAIKYQFCRVSKASAKKRRGRPPKFQISEIGEDGRKWYSCRWPLRLYFWNCLTRIEICSVCEQKYEDRMELMQHMRQHNAVRWKTIYDQVIYNIQGVFLNVPPKFQC